MAGEHRFRPDPQRSAAPVEETIASSVASLFGLFAIASMTPLQGTAPRRIVLTWRLTSAHAGDFALLAGLFREARARIPRTEAMRRAHLSTDYASAIRLTSVIAIGQCL